ncbi:discoidin domain-containing protein [Rugosimonospora africana]|uniref:F5/8 type C domain-containing protein n=1 Tax=Rugosimonospora africana TaxID=556532 RepID=A0A8J3QSY8_9ACTN|nr:discoidin domain-containing protein [Rugosimonospora africana]GIH15068.1 hypothetical protein Raf01_32400 [Rugosimonospora africana]
MRPRTDPLHRERAHDQHAHDQRAHDHRPPAPHRHSPAAGLLPVATLAAAALAICAASPAAAHANPVAAHPAAATCIASGTDAAINAALAGTGAEAVLCPGAVFQLGNPITFTAPNQKIYTQGLPTDATRANLVVTGSGLSTAIQGNGQPGVVVRNIQINGNRPALGVVSGGGALLEMGGAGTNQTVQNIYAHDTRSWSTLHFIEGRVTDNTPQCQGGQILDNQLGPAGTATPDATGVWADGISLACGGSLVQGNTITDATDGAIVVFGAPGSTVQNNTIVAKNQLLLGGINMVDYAPMNGNYTGTVVTHNTIDALSAFIKMGIAQGQQAWNCLTGTNYGATVTGNTLEGQYMGYGYAVDGVSDWTVTGNVDNSRHVGTQTAGGCFGSPRASQPAGYQVESATSSDLQPEFTSAVLTNALGTLNSPPITAPSGPALAASPSSVSFGNQAIGTTSAPRTVTVTNTGGSAAAISSITASAHFAQANTCGTALAAGASCTVTVTFSPAAAGAANGSVAIASNAANSPTTIALSGTGTGTATNLALAATMTASSTAPGYPATNANDGNGGSYWESVNGSGFPQTLTANLGSSQNLGSLRLRLPPSTAWAARTETLSVLGSTNGTTYTTVLPSAGYTFDPATGNTVSVSLPAGTAAQYLRLSVTANTGWPAAQVAEFEIYSSGGTTTPTNLALNAPITGSSHTQTYLAGNAVDGNTGTYWEGAGGAWPTTLTVDLTTAKALGSVVLHLPPATAWSTRTQTLTVLGSTDNSAWSTLVGSATYTFDPATGNAVTITLPAGTTDRYLRLSVTANTVQNAAQVSEFQVFGA